MNKRCYATFCGAVLVTAVPAWAGTLPLITKCPPDAVLVGQTCVDTYEASVWQIPLANKGLINKVKKGTAKLTDLTKGGATEISPSSSCSPSFSEDFPANGNWRSPLYAVSVPGVPPTACVTWFQAEQACRLAGKRLLTNQEWQAAAAGTPDTSGGADNGSTDCNINSVGDAVNTGSRVNCRSSWGAFDMVGNVGEWVADWMPLSTACPGWSGRNDDLMCLAGAEATVGPGALLRGGEFGSGTVAGVFAVSGLLPPFDGGERFIGFRCAR